MIHVSIVTTIDFVWCVILIVNDSSIKIEVTDSYLFGFGYYTEPERRIFFLKLFEVRYQRYVYPFLFSILDISSDTISHLCFLVQANFI